jgi:hypothetical protein
MAKAEATSPRYTDQQVIAATGLPLDSLRRLITWGAVRPAQAGGGRGRVRLWTTRQALRISVTAQFADAGYSLQMAHTLTYCVPLDGVLSLYDPETLSTIVPELRGEKFPRPTTALQLLELLTKTKEPEDWWVASAYPGGETLIVDGRYLYCNLYGKGLSLMAEIDALRQSVVPYSNPTKGTTYDTFLKKELPTDVARISHSSLLINPKELKSQGKDVRRKVNVPTKLKVGREVLCKSALSLNLVLGFVLCVRALNGIPSRYRPSEF